MPRKKAVSEDAELPEAQVKVRIEPYFAVRAIEDSRGLSHAHLTFTGATARKALQNAKNHLVIADRSARVTMFVTNARLIEAIGWSAPTYPDDPELLERILRLTGGELLP